MPGKALPQTLGGLLAARAKSSPAVDALVDDAGRISYAELESRTAHRAAWFVAQGVNKGHRIALMMENGIEWAINAYAALRIGAVLVPLSTLLRPAELTAQLQLAGVRHLIVTRQFRKRSYGDDIAALDRAALPGLRNIWWKDDLGDEDSGTVCALATALEARVVPADDMVVIFTSGSRASPRGVIHTHGGGIRAVAAGLEARCIDFGTRLYIPMPFFWVGGFAMGLISALAAGATLLTEAEPQPASTLDFLVRERATLFRGWPDQAARIAADPGFAAADLSALTDASLAAVLPPQRRSRPGSRANVLGMTESFGSYTGWPLDQDMPQGKWGSCGTPFAGMKLRIADPESGSILPAGMSGTIQIGGHNILRSICGSEREEVFSADGWYDTGDMGHIDADGFLWFSGRRDDMVKINGASTYPSEIEIALADIDGVKRVHATDISLDGQMTIGAAVIAERGCAIDVAMLDREARTRLSAFKVPKVWAILLSEDDIPRNASDKVDKAALQALLLGQNRA